MAGDLRQMALLEALQKEVEKQILPSPLPASSMSMPHAALELGSSALYNALGPKKTLGAASGYKSDAMRRREAQNKKK